MKSKEVSILVIASLILLPFLGGESFAQSNQVLTVTTEKESYAAGEPIEVFGLVDINKCDLAVRCGSLGIATTAFSCLLNQLFFLV